jgi:redox-sensing transcriptional repressor
VDCGIVAIWNFAPKDLKLPESVVVQRTDLATSFAVLSAKVKRKIANDELSNEVDEW